ncbi:MAG: MoaD/ThiS family protein [Deltaproteobacteria bacterium]|nr:MoaD/ThiS family protein [Deltaproteobacteria bacterium]
MPTVTVKLGGSLRNRAADPREGLETLVLPEGSRIADILSYMGIAPKEARIVLRNARSTSIDAPLEEGDRVALFPPELAFNLYVALCLGRHEDGGTLYG